MGQEFSTDGMLDIFLFESSQLIEKLDELVIEKKDADAFDSDDINEILDSLTEVVDKISDLIKLIGNGKTVLLG